MIKTIIILTCCILFGNNFSEAQYVPVDLNYNETYNLFDRGAGGYAAYFSSTPVEFGELPGVSFNVALQGQPGFHVLSTTDEGPESINIDIDDTTVYSVFIVGTGTWLGGAYGHNLIWCDNLSHFSFTLNYLDGSSKELLPILIPLNEQRWGDILYGDANGYPGVAAGSFGAAPPKYYHLYVLPANGNKVLESVTLNDYTSGSYFGDYSILAMTLKVDGLITVDNLNDDGSGSLRSALDEANNDKGSNIIEFDISGQIEPLTELPTITDPSGIYIHGSSAPDKAGSIIIDGGSQNIYGLQINTSFNIIEGINLTNFGFDGIRLLGDNATHNQIINNQISNSDNGITLLSQCNYNQIGGYAVDEKNIIIDNLNSGIKLDSYCDSNIIAGNQIGGTQFELEQGNLVNGIWFGNGCDYNLVDSNEITYNGTGIALALNGTCNTISQNQIYLNDILGIDLNNNGTVEINDPGDLDSGPNNLLNYPEVDSIRMNSDSSFTVWGTTLNDTEIEFFVAHPAENETQPADPSGFGEAYTYLGNTTSGGKSSFQFEISNDTKQFTQITMTATDQDGNTSEFSENFVLTPSPLIIVAWGYDPTLKGDTTDALINIWVTDENSDYIGKDADNILSNTITNATYTETGAKDSVHILSPLLGTYTIEIIGVIPDPPPGAQYGIGILIDGSNLCAMAESIMMIEYGATSSFTYEVGEGWHYINADADGDDVINILDITFLIDYLYKSGPTPYPLNSGDVNCNLTINILDITYLISHLYKDGPPPCSLY